MSTPAPNPCPSPRRPIGAWPRWLWALLASLALGAAAEPYRPASDDDVLTRLPTRRSDPAARALAALREAARAAPRDATLALAAARAALDQARALGDPRYVGQAQAALAPWWAQKTPPADIQVMRAIIARHGQRFDEALADLQAVVAREPGHREAWSELATLHLLRADTAAARRACDALSGRAPALAVVGCRAGADALSGHADMAAAALRAALDAGSGTDPQADPVLRLAAWTQLAEIEAQRGEPAAAEAAFEAALALGLDDVTLRAAYADLLLDQGRPGEVLVQLRQGSDADVLLLRLALAAKAASSPLAARYADELAARLDAARLRGDSSHRKEEARFELTVRGRPQVALALARAHYALQRRPADARLLLEAALAARQPAAADPVLRWMAASGVDSPRLQALAERLRSLR